MLTGREWERIMLTGREWELWYLIMDLHRTGKAPGFGKDKLLCLWLHTWRPNACVHKNAVRWRRGESLGIRNKGMERKENPDCTQQGNYLPILRRLPPTDRRWASLRSSGPHLAQLSPCGEGSRLLAAGPHTDAIVCHSPASTPSVQGFHTRRPPPTPVVFQSLAGRLNSQTATRTFLSLSKRWTKSSLSKPDSSEQKGTVTVSVEESSQWHDPLFVRPPSPFLISLQGLIGTKC